MEGNKLYTILQLCDSAFPVGGFSHSMGIEPAIKHLYINDQGSLNIFIRSCLENAGSFCIPFIKAAHKQSTNLKKLTYLDSLLSASILNNVAHRASKQQGKSFLNVAYTVFHLTEINEYRHLVGNQTLHFHLPVVFGAVCAALRVPVLEACQMYLFSVLRTIVSSLVRLGKVGAIQAQGLQFELQGKLDAVVSRNWNLSPEASSITFPMTEALQNCHDVIFAKLFFS